MTNNEHISKKQNYNYIANNLLDENDFIKFLNRIFQANNLVVSLINYRIKINSFLHNFHLNRVNIDGDGLCFKNSIKLYHKIFRKTFISID
jgi:hypothetical protein